MILRLLLRRGWRGLFIAAAEQAAQKAGAVLRLLRLLLELVKLRFGLVKGILLDEDGLGKEVGARWDCD